MELSDILKRPIHYYVNDVFWKTEELFPHEIEDAIHFEIEGVQFVYEYAVYRKGSTDYRQLILNNCCVELVDGNLRLKRRGQ